MKASDRSSELLCPQTRSRARPSAIRTCIALLLTTFSPTVSPAAPVSQTHLSSPSQVHKYIRGLVSRGQDATQVIDRFVATKSDHSFDGLKLRSAAQVEALRLRERAIEEWNQEDLHSARRLLMRARSAFLAARIKTEALFCAYQIAETYADEEKFAISLRWIEQALTHTEISNMPYLSGLLYESRGYSLWYLGDLQNSILSFLESVKRWQQIDFAEGLTNAWNNLAALYEELGMTDRAKRCYLQALQNMLPSAYPEQKFHIHRNYALFLHRSGHFLKAIEHLEKSSWYSTVSPNEFRLAQAEIMGRLEILEGVHGPQASIAIERDLLRAKLMKDRLNPKAYVDQLRKILDRCREVGLDYYARESSHLLGKAIEQLGDYRAAAEAYRTGLRQEEARSLRGVALPYWQAVSPLFKGWIRCLIRLGMRPYARRKIQESSYSRRENVRLLLNQSRSLDFSDDELTQLVKLTGDGQLEVQARHALDDYLPGHPDEGQTFLELWPDGSMIHSWIESKEGTRYLSYQISEKASALSQRVCEYFYGLKSGIASKKPLPLTARLYAELIAPVSGLLKTRRILIIPHNELQAIPFELLLCPDGRRLGEKHILSYLPDPDSRFREAKAVHSPPLLLLPSEFSHRQGARREEEVLRRYASNLRIVEDIDGSEKLTGRWIHVSTHFSLHPHFWPASSFENGPVKTNLISFLKRGLECRLLALAVCGSANAYSSSSPYWLGVTEVFLARGAQALIANRWGMDEFSAEIFLDFYRYALSGFPMDESLYLARKQFLKRKLPRNGQTVSGSHPFFWAGICYIGWPGRPLRDDGRDPLTSPPCLFSIPAVFLLAELSYLLLRRTRR